MIAKAKGRREKSRGARRKALEETRRREKRRKAINRARGKESAAPPGGWD